MITMYMFDDGEAGGAAPSDAAAGLAPTGVEAERNKRQKTMSTNNLPIKKVEQRQEQKKQKTTKKARAKRPTGVEAEKNIN